MMDTRDLPDETVLPGHQYSLGEMRQIIATMRKVNAAFYADAFASGIGGSCHAFIEFAGLQAKFIDLCEDALRNGVEFPFANQHSGARWPLAPHHAQYLGEKFECIYGFALKADPTLAEAFVEGLSKQKADGV